MTISQKKLMTEAKDYLVITLGLLLYTFAWTVFLLPCRGEMPSWPIYIPSMDWLQILKWVAGRI